MNMYELAKEFKRKHKDVNVTNVTNYSFTVTTIPLKENEKPVTKIYMKSYFLKF